MTSDSLQRVDRAIWLTIAAVGLIDVIAAVAGPFVIAWKMLLLGTGLCGALVAAGFYYRHIRHEEQIALVILSIAQLLAFSAVSVALSYVAAAAAFPTWDAELTIWDKSLGLDWIAWLRFMDFHPYWHWPLRMAYMSLVAQPFIFVVVLVACRQVLQLRVFIVGTVLTILIVIAVSMVLPAAGPGLDPLHPVTRPENFSPASWVSWPIFNGLRTGSYRGLFTSDVEGIVQFPSYHAAAALLGILAMWPVRYVRWVTLALNLAMIVATPIDGGHYFVDIFAGLLLAALCWKAAAWMIAPHPSEARSVTVVEAPSIVPAAASALAAAPTHTSRSHQSDLNPV